MITSRTVQQCGQADYGWLQARYTFSFGHYFDPQLLGYASLRVLNQEVLTPGASFQPKTWPKVDVVNLILQGEAEYRDSDGNHVVARAGEALLLAAQPGISYSEHNLSSDQPLTRMQLWLDACPDRENAPIQCLSIPDNGNAALLASPDGAEQSLQLRQQAWIYHIKLQPGEDYTLPLRGARAYLQSIHGSFTVTASSAAQQVLACGDGAFIAEEQAVTIRATTPTRALVIDLAE
ncbi:MAG TPA: pirin family protein [Erwinia sp.]|uniref:pirin family protein n=1 Tax=Erwinia citreus TaxID=558 RepID=UPI000E995CCA|nr:pirin family protein [Erwinia sp.]HBV40493.1 pirin family protein [Erwinia sp.]